MSYEIRWRSPDILEFRFFGEITGPEFVDCITQGEFLIDQRDTTPFYVWVDVKTLHRVPSNVVQIIMKSASMKYVPRGLVVIGATSYFTMIVRLVAVTFWGVNFWPIFVASEEEGLAALNRMMRAATI